MEKPSLFVKQPISSTNTVKRRVEEKSHCVISNVFFISCSLRTCDRSELATRQRTEIPLKKKKIASIEYHKEPRHPL